MQDREISPRLERRSMLAMPAILVLSVAPNFGWKRIHVGRTRSDHPGR